MTTKTKEKDATKKDAYLRFVLPSSVVSKVDVAHLVEEFERVDDALTSAHVRSKAGTHKKETPVVSGPLADFLEQNKLSFEESRDRSALLKQLRLLKDKAPIIHMTFASTADGESLQKLVSWLRESIHPQAVIEVGLQPALIGGVYLRTPNQVHDFSVRGALKQAHDLLLSELEGLRGAK